MRVPGVKLGHMTLEPETKEMVKVQPSRGLFSRKARWVLWHASCPQYKRSKNWLTNRSRKLKTCSPAQLTSRLCYRFGNLLRNTVCLEVSLTRLRVCKTIQDLKGGSLWVVFSRLANETLELLQPFQKPFTAIFSSKRHSRYTFSLLKFLCWSTGNFLNGVKFQNWPRKPAGEGKTSRRRILLLIAHCSSSSVPEILAFKNLP